MMENNLESRPSLYDAAAYLTGTNIINIFPTIRSYCLNDLADTVDQSVDAPVFDVISPIFSESIIKCMTQVPEKE